MRRLQPSRTLTSAVHCRASVPAESYQSLREQQAEHALLGFGENIHENHMLNATNSVPHAEEQMVAAKELAVKILTKLDYVGVMGVELFDTPDGLLVNELAPRVHNSGHWTPDACITGQFEQHVRAILGWPLGDTSRHSNAVMTNLLGDEVDAWDGVANSGTTKIHMYGKRISRPGRKMGHVCGYLRNRPANRPRSAPGLLPTDRPSEAILLADPPMVSRAVFRAFAPA